MSGTLSVSPQVCCHACKTSDVMRKNLSCDTELPCRYNAYPEILLPDETMHLRMHGNICVRSRPVIANTADISV